MSTPKYKLIYFNWCGWAETARFMFAYKNVPYEDVRMERFSDTWDQLKPTTPMGKLPLLYIDDFLLCQSGAINRYLARELDLYGKTRFETATSDMIFEGMMDGLNILGPWWYASKEEKARIMPELKPKMGSWAKSMEALLKKSNGPWYCGNTLTWCDFHAANTMFLLTEGIYREVPIDCGDVIPQSLKDHRARVEALPGVKEWIAKRPKTEY